MRSLLLLPLLAGCTFTPGAAFTHVESASLTTSLEPGVARDLGDGAFLTSEGFEVTPTAMSVELARVSLQAVEGASGASFDPANPPDDYTLCHAGHCHHVDGRLVPYAEIEVELAGGTARLIDVLGFPLEGEADLLDSTSTPLTVATPDLDESTVRLLAFDVRSLRLTAEVAGEGTVYVDLPVAAPITTGIDVVIDRDFPAVVALSLSLPVDATFLDGLDLTGGLVVDDPGAPEGASILDALASQVPTLIITELDP